MVDSAVGFPVDFFVGFPVDTLVDFFVVAFTILYVGPAFLSHSVSSDLGLFAYLQH